MTRCAPAQPKLYSTIMIGQQANMSDGKALSSYTALF
jgi:hypothetical protein